MVRRYTWMLCLAMLCLLWLSSLTNATTAAPTAAAPALMLRQDADAAGDDEGDPDDSDQDKADQDKADQDKADSDEADSDEADSDKAKEDKKAAFKPAAGSLSYLKIGLIILFFLPWVRYVDSINRDTMEFGKKLQLEPEIWNPILVGSFLIGLLAVLFVPIFWAGFPFFVLAALAPPITYSFIRRNRVKSDDSIARAIQNSSGGEYEVEELPQDEGAEVSFSTGGADANEKQARLIRGRQSQEFPTLKNLIHDAQFKRTEQLLSLIHI